MAIQFTEKQTSVLNARNHNIIVSAAAGSGKTAVLVERIIRMISEPDPVTGRGPLDIDRLLVVTFTKAAAAQMRERIAAAIARRLEETPEDRHLQRQATLLHHAQITTIDSFCTFLLRNNFSEIDLDPGFRQMDNDESRLLRGDVWETFLESQYENADPAFMALMDIWCAGNRDEEIGSLVMKLVDASESHPNPIRWLQERRADYDITGWDDLLLMPWMADMMQQILRQFQSYSQMFEAGIANALRPGGPAPHAESFTQYQEEMFAAYGALDPMAGVARDIEMLQNATHDQQREQILEQRRAIYERITRTLHYKMKSLKQIRGAAAASVDPVLKEQNSSLKSQVNDACKELRQTLSCDNPQMAVQLMQCAADSLHTLIDLAISFTETFRSVKAEKGVIDFGDLERFALNILVEEQEDPSAPGGIRYVARKPALAYRTYFDEVLIDEYQDSNEVQELLLGTIAGEDDGRYARFMVGDVKQSIYRFRNARPEIFVDKLDHYKAGDGQTERIDLDQNFRSRTEVLDATNDVFLRIMRREIGGVTYDDQVTLKPGASYETPDDQWAEARAIFGEDLYKARLLLVHETPAQDGVADDGANQTAGDAVNGKDGAAAAVSNPASSDAQAGASDGTPAGGEAASDEDPDEIAAMPYRLKEALAIAQEIQNLVGVYPVTDEESHELRPARYRDIVVLLRSGGAWNDAFREVFEREGIPLYVDYKAGYFAAEEIREILQVLRVIDNPAQDIPLYGMMHGYFGQFTEDELGQIRAAARCMEKERRAAAEKAQEPDRDSSGKDRGYEIDLLTAVRLYDADPGLAARCRAFLARVEELRAEAQVTPIHQFLMGLVTRSGYENYITALPAGEQRRANLQLLIVKAAAFEETQYAGLFEFVRYIDSMRQYEIDSGEANVLDEKADVVRLMTIHKSKGLEFPIVFVAGLAGKFAFKGKDAAGSLIVDPDLGLGIDYIDPNVRARIGNLRKAAVADRIRRSSLGEELRILYVAMTRAKERLYLSGYVRDLCKYQAKIDAARAGIVSQDELQLPVQVITSAANYLDLVMLAMDGRTRIDLQPVAARDLKTSEEQAQETLYIRKEHLQAAVYRPMQDLPMPALVSELDERFSFRYPHEELTGLYTKCSVSDVKHAVYMNLAIENADETGEESADAAYELFQMPPEEDADIPRFAREETADAVQAPLHGAARGTAIHRALQLVDYEEWENPGQVTARMFNAWREEIVAAGLVPRSYESVLTVRTFLPFLHSGLAERMAEAENSGTLRREQPFVLGVPADTVNPAFPHSETMLVQGIIDAFWIEETDAGRGIVIVDYKTDMVRDPQELIDRYDVQLRYYAEALSRILHLPVHERILYSFRLQREIVLPEAPAAS